MLTLPKDQRHALWERVLARVEDYVENIDHHPVSLPVDVEAMRASLAPFDFAEPVDPLDAVDFVADSLWRGQVHTSHRKYYGLFNPNPTTMGIAADTLVAAFNPQLAAWSHNPAACEMERHLLVSIGERFGYTREVVAGSFTSGGAEANHTALSAALNHAFPEYAAGGTRAIDGAPVFYVSEESHHSFAKAARLCGLGTDAVCRVPLDEGFVMDTAALRRQIASDRTAGKRPFLVVATMGSTNAGLVDPIDEISAVAAEEGLWVHADAAWGGAAVLVPGLRAHLGSIGRADSITFDAHKWMSVPMGAGMFFTRHAQVLERTFAIDTQYMPVTKGVRVIEPHLNSMQWSRRFIGLKVFLSLAVAGWDGYAEAIQHQYDMGDVLREKLAAAGWRVVNDTVLPTVCFVDARSEDNDLARLRSICAAIVDPGRAWISTTRMGGVVPVLRACITNYRTGRGDIEELVSDLGNAREWVNGG